MAVVRTLLATLEVLYIIKVYLLKGPRKTVLKWHKGLSFLLFLTFPRHRRIMAVSI